MAGPTPTKAEDEALKRNTDCVYFLASPLTCKKGSECEFRHSDMARLNPRDCWYWLNGNCLNPKCAFRHPPLDGFLDAQVPTVPGSSAAPVVSGSPMPQVPYASGKKGVTCVFFQRGLCLKGDKCAFMHAPNSVPNKLQQPPVSTAPGATPTVKKPVGVVEKSAQVKNLSQTNILNAAELPKPVGKLENHLTKNDKIFNEDRLPPNPVINREHLRLKPTSVLPTSGPNRVHQHIGNDHSSIKNKEDDFSREPSPGFDVLVDNELRDSDYYHDEDHYGGTSDNRGRNEYDMGEPVDYDRVVDIDRDMYNDVHRYDSYDDRLPHRYAWEQHLASEKISGGPAHLERRRYGTVDSPERVELSDLRHRLSKPRRSNGLKSVISHDFSSEKHVDDQTNKSYRREAFHTARDSSLSSRLRGRIKLPVSSSSPTDRAGLQLDRQMDRTRDRGRFSSERPQLSSNQGRLQDRIKGRVQEDLKNSGRNNRGSLSRRNTVNNSNSEFSGPKSLAELKGRKASESNEQNLNEQQPLGKRKHRKADNGEDLSFEGPMPLQEILKRKKGGGTGMTSSGCEDSQHGRDQTTMTSMVRENGDIPYAISKTELLHIQKEESKLVSGDINGPHESKSTDQQSPLHRSANEAEAEEEMIVEGADTQDPENYYEGDGDDYYEPVEGEDYTLDEGEVGGDEEYLDDDDDGDDFAKKLGVVSS